MTPRREDKKDRRVWRVEDLDDILDAAAGIPKRSELPPDDNSDPVPLSEGFVQRAVEQRRALQAARDHQLAMRQRSRRRRAAIIPLGLGLLILAAATTYSYIWPRKHASNLMYEDALITVFDESVPENSRRVALGKIATSILNTITSIKRAASRNAQIQPTADRALSTFLSLTRSPEPAGDEQNLLPGQLEAILNSMASQDSVAALTTSIEQATNGCRPAFRAMREVRGARLKRLAELQLRSIRRRIQD